MNRQRTEHVHCYDTYPGGVLLVCKKKAPLQLDTELVIGGVSYRPLLVWHRNAMVIQRDHAKAYVLTPHSKPGPPVVDKTHELIGAGA